MCTTGTTVHHGPQLQPNTACSLLTHEGRATHSHIPVQSLSQVCRTDLASPQVESGHDLALWCERNYSTDSFPLSVDSLTNTASGIRLLGFESQQ